MKVLVARRRRISRSKTKRMASGHNDNYMCGNGKTSQRKDNRLLAARAPTVFVCGKMCKVFSIYLSANCQVIDGWLVTLETATAKFQVSRNSLY